MARQRVVAITKMALGGIAEYAIADTISVFDAPAQFDDVEATAFLLTFQTSHLALFRRGRLQAGETVVIHSAASGLGTAGIQLGKAAGARVIAVAGGPEKGACVPRWGPTWSSTTSRRTSSKRSWPPPVTPGPKSSTTCPVGISWSARGAARREGAATWPWDSRTTTRTG